MKVSIFSEDINKILRLTSKVITIKATESDIKLLGFNERDKIWIESKVDGDIDSKGSVSISKEVLKNITNGEIIITDSEIYCGTRKINFKNEEPILSVEATENSVILSNYDAKKLLEIQFATAQDETRPILQGICIDENNLIALDGYRLAIRKHDELKINELIVHNSLITYYKKLKGTSNLKILDDDLYTTFEFDNFKITHSKIQGKFINYKSLLPKEYKTLIRFDSKKLLSLLKSYKDIKIIKILIKKEKLIIQSSNSYMKIEDTLNCKTQGQELEIGFNPKYLIDSLKNFDGEIIMKFNNKVSPAIIEKDYKYDLILPIRIIK